MFACSAQSIILRSQTRSLGSHRGFSLELQPRPTFKDCPDSEHVDPRHWLAITTQDGVESTAREKMKVQAIPVTQWLPEWDRVHFDAKLGRRKPRETFYLFALEAKQLRDLCGIYRRTLQKENSPSARTGIQRRHDRRDQNKLASTRDTDIRGLSFRMRKKLLESLMICENPDGCRLLSS